MFYGPATLFFQWIKGLVLFGVVLLASWNLPAYANVLDSDTDDYDPLPGRTAEQIDALIFNFDEVVETVVLYTALVALLIILLALAASMRLQRWVGYTALTLVSLLWFGVYEQHVTDLYWIGFEASFASLTIVGTPLISAHFFLAGWYIGTGSGLRWMKPVLLCATAAPWIALGLNWPLPDEAIPSAIAFLAALSCASHLLTISSFDGIEDQPIYTRRNAIVVLIALALTAFAVFGELDEGLDASFAARSLFAAVVFLFAFFLVQFVIAILRDRDASVRTSLKIAQRESAQAHALLEAEKNYARAKETARLHTLRLANASHDIRQPIASLRATMAAVSMDQSAEIQTQLKAAFDYLDQLARSYTETETPPNETALQHNERGTEAVSARMLCDTLDRMFRKEAEAKQLTFDVKVEEQELNVPPLVVTRILSNLLSNAIKHTQSGHITLAAGQNPDGYQFCVENSAGMTAEIIDAGPFAYGAKDATSDGSGFGLAIVKKLTETHGLDLDWSSDPQRGTQFRLNVGG